MVCSFSLIRPEDDATGALKPVKITVQLLESEIKEQCENSIGMPYPEISGGYLPILLMRATLRLDMRMCIPLFLWVAGKFQFGHGAGRSSTLTENLDKKFGPVVLANVLFRHGDRTPLTSYPRDPYANLSEWEIGWGQVTELGMYQEFVLGRQLRERYSRLLPLRYSSQDVYVLSSDVDRTLTAAQITSAGLYHGVKHSSPLVKFQAVPVHSNQQDVDDVLAPIPICPRYFKELKKVLKTQQLRCIARKNRKIYSYVSLNAGMKEFDLSIYDTLRVQEMHNLSLPSWTKAVYPTKLRQIAMYTMFILPGITKDLQKYSIGRLLGDMVLHMTQKRYQKLHPDRRLFLYSAHEFTVANLLHALGVWEVQDPPYCAAVLVELRLHNKNFFVTVSYKNSTEGDPHLLTLPNCEEGCPLERFIEITKSIIPEDHDSECKKDPTKDQPDLHIPPNSLPLDWDECLKRT